MIAKCKQPRRSWAVWRTWTPSDGIRRRDLLITVPSERDAKRLAQKAARQAEADGLDDAIFTWTRYISLVDD